MGNRTSSLANTTENRDKSAKISANWFFLSRNTYTFMHTSLAVILSYCRQLASEPSKSKNARDSPSALARSSNPNRLL